MPIPSNVKREIDKYRDNNPRYEGLSDRVLYRKVKRASPHLAWEEEDSGRGIAANTSPGFMNSFQEWIDGPINEKSYNWWRDAYNKSLTGMTEQLITGKQRYKLDEGYTPNVLEDIGSMALSFFMPLDMLAMAAGGGIGKGALALTGIEARAGAEFGKRAMHHVLPTALQQAGSLAVYEGAIGGVDAAIRGEDVMGAVFDGVMHGGILGGIAGSVGGGLAYRNAELIRGFEAAGKLAKGEVEASKMLTRTDRAKMVGTGMVGQIGAESGVFTASEQVDKKLHGEDVNLRDIFASYGKNLGLFGLLKGQKALWNRGKKHLDMLEASEIEKAGADKDGSTSEGRLLQKVLDPMLETSRMLKEDGKLSEAAANDKIIADLIAKKSKVDKKHLDSMEEFGRIRNWIDDLLTVGKKGTPEKKRADKYINAINSLIGVETKLLKGAKHGTAKIYKSFIKEFEMTRDSLMEEARLWTTPTDKLTKTALAGKIKALFPGEKITEIEVDGVPKSIKDATREEVAEWVEGVEAGLKTTSELKRQEYAPDEASKVDEVQTHEKFKEDIEITRKEEIAEEHAELPERYREAVELDKKVTGDDGGFTDPAKRQAYESNKDVVRDHIQNIYPIKSSATVGKGKYLKLWHDRVKAIQDFAKFLASKNKTWKRAIRRDFIEFSKMKGNKTKYSGINDLRSYLMETELSPRLSLTRNMLEQHFKKVPLSGTTGAKFFQSKKHRGKDVVLWELKDGEIHVRTPKQTEDLVLPITKELYKDLKALQNKNAPEGHRDYIFRDTKNQVIFNNEIKNIVAKFFGKKVSADSSKFGRAFRDAITSWVVEKHGRDAYNVVLREVLGDRSADAKAVERAYDKYKGTELGKFFLNDYIKEIFGKSDPRKRGMQYVVNPKDYFSTLEIRKGFQKLNKVKGKTVQIGARTYNKKTLEAMFKYIVETAPRINEIAPEKADFNRHLREIGAEFQLKSAASRIGTTVAELRAQTSYFKKVFPELTIGLEKDLGKYQGEYVLGRISGYAIDIAKGRAMADTIPHEVSHHVVDILRGFGDARSKQLIKDGERMFKGEENLVQAVGEFAAGRMRNKSMSSKVKNWLQKFWSNIKTRLNMHTSEDVARIIGERVLKGNLPKGQLAKLTTKYQTLPTKEKINAKINAKTDHGKGKSLRAKVLDEARNDLKREEIRIFGKTIKRGYLKNATLDQMLEYQRFLDNHPANGGSSKSSIPLSIAEVNEKYHVMPEVSKEILKLMGVKDGLYEYASDVTAKEYASYIRSKYNAPVLSPTTFDLGYSLKNTKLSWYKNWSRAVMPVWLVLKNYGGEPGRKIAKRLLDHEYIEHVRYKGKGDQAIYKIKKRLGRKSKYIHIFDKERAERNFNEGTLSKEAESIYKNIHGEKPNKNSDEYKAYQIWTEYTEKMWKSLETELSRHQTPEGVRRIMKGLDRTKVEGYMTRRLSQKALEYITEDSNYITKLVKDNVLHSAAREARKRGEGMTEERIKLIENRLKDIGTPEGKEFYQNVRTELYDAITFGFTNVKNPHLIERGTLLPEYVEITNANKQREKIKVYEDSIDATAETYVRRMSKYLASVSLFPEWTGIGNKYKIDMSKRQIMEQMEQNPDLGGYAIKSIKRQLGIDRSDFESLSRPIYKAFASITNTSAALGLSSPTSGIKNLAIGIPRSIGDFGFMNTMRGIKYAFNSMSWHEARKKGYLEYGAKTLELGSVGWGDKLNMKNLFKYVNWMTPTENINRIASAHAGHLYFIEATAKLRGEKGMFKMGTNKKRMKSLMEELWHLEPEDIKFLETTKDFTVKESMAKHAEILNKVGHFSHVSSQGGTSTILLPLWMSSKEAKPLTLFQRMATATTIDTYRNFIKPAIKYGNIMPLARAAVAHSVSGALLYAMYDELFGKAKPIGSKEMQGDWFSNILMNVWRSEFLGVFGDILSPYERDLSVPISSPIIFRNLSEAHKEWNQWALGGKTGAQAVKDYAKHTAVIVGQFGDAFPKVHSSEYYKNFMKIRSMRRQWKTQRNMEMYSPEGSIYRTQPYYRDLKYAMMFENEEGIAKAYWKAYDAIVTDEEDTNPYSRPRARSKKAKGMLKQVIKLYDPFNISDSLEGTTKSLQNQFLDWLTPENEAIARNVKKEFEYRQRQYLKIVRKSKWKKLHSVYPDLA